MLKITKMNNHYGRENQMVPWGASRKTIETTHKSVKFDMNLKMIKICQRNKSWSILM